MADRNQRRSTSGSSTTVRNVVAIILLTALVGALVVIALTQNRDITNAGAAPGVSPVPSATPIPSTPAATAAPVAVAVPTRAIGALDGQNAVRAVSTNCPDQTTVEVTADGGATWSPAEPSTLATVQSIVQGADAFIGMIGLGIEGCAPAYERSFTDGAAWEDAPNELGASWYLDPADRASLHSPTGTVTAPCAVAVQVAALDDASAAVLCEDATVHGTADGGASWGDPVAVPGASAISVGGSGYRVAVINANACVGTQLAEMTAEGAVLEVGTPGTCLAATVAMGEVVLATGDDGATWVWAGDVVARSQDGGVSWL